MRVTVIGGGPAGMAAALAAKRAGAEEVLLVERAERLGGVLPQCIHTGFGVSYFKEDLTGPEFAERLERQVEKAGVEVWLNAITLQAFPDRQLLVSTRGGLRSLRPDILIFAVGARERPRGSIAIPGDRPAGIFTAGTAQYMTNIQGLQVGREFFILGSGDIGLIMARRFTLEGLVVHGVAELMPFPGGLSRNIQQCLRDYAIPLWLSHTVTGVRGSQRVEAVTVAPVDSNGCPLLDRERTYAVDSLVLSVGLLPESELLRQAGLTMVPETGGPAVDQYYQCEREGIFAVGNGVAIWDLADNVAETAEVAGRAAVLCSPGRGWARVEGRGGIRVVIPQRWRLEERDLVLHFRAGKPAIAPRLRVTCKGQLLARRGYAALRPAEMEEIRIPAEKLAAVEAGDLIVLELEEGSGG